MATLLPLKAAIGIYDHTRPLKDGSICSKRVSLELADITPVNRAFRRTVNDLSFDVSELAIVTYMMARAAGRPLLGVPVVLQRLSPFASIVCNTASGIREPKDLEGRRIGVRSYTQTTGVWLRGILAEDYGVDLGRIQWLTGEGAHLDSFEDPSNVSRAEDGADFAAMLLAGDLDATVGVTMPPHADVRPLFPDADDATTRWSKRTGLSFVNHVLVVKAELAAEHPWLTHELFDVFDAARVEARQAIRSGSAPLRPGREPRAH